MRVRAAGVNRADCLQRAGTYPVPPGMSFSPVPGLELAGEVVEVGTAVTGFAPGDRVLGLVAGGAYAEYALVDRGLSVPLPERWDFAEGAAVIEVYCTANETLFELGRLAAGQTALIHAGASGVGTAAIQMARHIGATAFFTAGSQAKIDQATLKAQKIQTQAKSFYTKSSGVWPSSLQDLIISQGPGVPPLLDGGEADITDPWGNPYQFSIDLNQSGVETFYVFTQSPDGAPIRVPQN